MADTLPPIPKSVPSLLGPVAVSIVADIPSPEPDRTRFGEWSYIERRIRIKRDIPLIVQWATLYHEIMHMWLEDTGVNNGMDAELVERICDAAGTNRANELLQRRTAR